jgi:tetratricopeptide (TPR) repeat protein
MDDLDEYTTKGIANGVLEELQELVNEHKPDAKYVVDKLPHNFENIGFIKFLFPNAKIISVRRDPLDIAVSNYFQNFQAKHGGMGFAYDLEWIGEQLADHNLLMHHWNTLFANEILEVNYEDVVNNIEISTKRMLDYIGLEFEDELYEFNKLERPVKTASVWQVRQPIYKTAMQKWRRYEKYLTPLIKGTNAKIKWEPIEDMITLPVAGLFTQGTKYYENKDLDKAEECFKKMLHHNSEHAAASYMLGLVYLSKNHMEDGIELIEKAIKKVPWQKPWRDTLKKAYEEKGKQN